jgi:hypothetical protein
VEGLNILHMITADRIIGRISAKHTDGAPPEILPIGSTFENLKIGGQPVEVDLNLDLFLQNPTHAALLTHYETASKRGKAPKARYHWGAADEQVPPALAKGMLLEPGIGWHKSKSGVLHTSMVKQVRAVGSSNSAAELPYAYAIHIPHVGNLYLGEIFASADTKRLTMLRVELGSPFHGVVAAAEPVGNGTGYP